MIDTLLQKIGICWIKDAMIFLAFLKKKKKKKWKRDRGLVIIVLAKNPSIFLSFFFFFLFVFQISPSILFSSIASLHCDPRGKAEYEHPRAPVSGEINNRENFHRSGPFEP